jgi:glycerol-1-phosphate dehydrogenase [NAD(P)+]
VSDPAIAVVIAPDAIDRLAAYAASAGWARALAVMDANTRAAVGERTVGRLRAAGVDVAEFVFEQRGGLAAGLDEAAAIQAAADTILVAAGAGVITDIVRYAAHDAGASFVSVPSAASMDGYASPAAAMEIDGVKVTVPARPPEAIFADPRVAAAAPAELTRAGLGDLLAKATARVDWLAAHLLYDEPFSEEVAALALEPLMFAAANAEAVLAGGEDAIGRLLAGLVQSGIAMVIAGNSRPASGCEHHASHFWDLLASRGRRPHALHGLQVGYATRFAMRLQRFAFAGGVSKLRPPTAELDPLGPHAREWLGVPTPELEAAVQEKQGFVSALETWPADAAAWAAIRARLAPAMAVFDEVERALELAGMPGEPGYLEIDEPMLRAAFRYSGRLRPRFTVVDFLAGQGLLDRALNAMLAGRSISAEIP